MSPWNESGKVARHHQLTMIGQDSRDEFLAQELDEAETRIHTRITMLEDSLRDGFREIKTEMREVEDRATKRFTSLTAVLISLLVTIAGGAVMALINSQAG